jgi:hypothetical protein
MTADALPATLVGLMHEHGLALHRYPARGERPARWVLVKHTDVDWLEVAKATTLDDLARAAWDAGYTFE